jgi:hypothetical protein
MTKITIPIVSFVAGAIIAALLFFGTWGLVDAFLELIVRSKQTLLYELMWTLNFSAPLFIIGVMVRRQFEKRKPAYSKYLTLPVCLPVMAWLFLFAGITDNPYGGYINSTVGVVLPGLAYAVGLRGSFRKKT